ncbi:hypothetical protein [Mesobacillus campisalis]|uniref:hypothetical protein n=1 Tax=Mesobacillus campisalis TaxID=1408103 RepID=UPI000A9C36FA|nr:hypothetical protein [Mesobacillus campisalis]
MENYEITDMIIDDEMGIEEYATADFKQHGKNYRITFKKADLELVNAWILRMAHLCQRIYRMT